MDKLQIGGLKLGYLRGSFSVGRHRTTLTDRDNLERTTSSSSVIIDDTKELPDFVLVWKDKKDLIQAAQEKAKEEIVTRSRSRLRFKVRLPVERRREEKRRRIFLKNLKAVGLKIEYENDSVGVFKFAKLYARSRTNAGAGSNAKEDVLRKYAEILKLRMPMKSLPDQPEDEQMSGIYSRDKEYLFDMDESVVFNYTVRARIIGFVLSRTSYSDNTHNRSAYGVKRLIKFGVFEAAYPIHDPNIRDHLRSNWASLRKIMTPQPLVEIHDYFGVKIALYFAWLGYYTSMLIPAAVVGFICFIYGWATLTNDPISKDICEEIPKIKEKMCPFCDKCTYWNIKSYCGYAKIAYFSDNNATIFFAFFMSLWSAVFMSFWKRYSANIDHEWGLTSFDVKEEQPRPEYTAEVQKQKRKRRESVEMRTNKITNANEAYLPFSRSLPWYIFSVVSVVLLIILPIMFVICLILFRITIISYLGLDHDTRTYATVFISCCSAFFDLIFILLFNWIYDRVAYKLTELEMLRTETAFENSLTIKMYIVEFINYYSSIVYVAFFKGKYTGTPGHYTRNFGWRQEECGPIGCMTELFIHLAIIMIGKQFYGTVQELFKPYIKRWWRRRRAKVGNAPVHKQKPWERDFYLVEFGGPQSLFPEYLEMVIQYGFVTLFVAAFPLAPLFALINNVTEVRLDARKFLKKYRRPVAQRVKDIGSWAEILAWISRMAIIINALIISLTSSFIPKYVYWLEYGTLEGYLNFSLEKFDTSDPAFQNETAPKGSEDVKVCRYFAFIRRHRPKEEEKLWPANFREREIFYWKVWLGRLIFIILFQNVVTLCVEFLKWLIPEVPKKLSQRILREQYWTMEAVLMHERMLGRTRKAAITDSMSQVSVTSTMSSPTIPKGKDGPKTDKNKGKGKQIELIEPPTDEEETLEGLEGIDAPELDEDV